MTSFTAYRPVIDVLYMLADQLACILVRPLFERTHIPACGF